MIRPCLIVVRSGRGCVAGGIRGGGQLVADMVTDDRRDDSYAIIAVGRRAHVRFGSAPGAAVHACGDWCGSATRLARLAAPALAPTYGRPRSAPPSRGGRRHDLHDSRRSGTLDGPIHLCCSVCRAWLEQQHKLGRRLQPSGWPVSLMGRSGPIRMYPRQPTPVQRELGRVPPADGTKQVTDNRRLGGLGWQPEARQPGGPRQGGSE